MSLDLTAVLIAFAGNTFLSLFTLFKNPKSATNKLFFIFTLSLTIYLWVNFISTRQSTDEGAFVWVKLIMFIALIINLSFFLLVSTFPYLNLQINKKIFWLSIIFTLLILPLVPLNLVFTSAKAHAASGSPGIGMGGFLLHTVLFLGGGFIILVKKFKQSTGVIKTQIRLFFVGAILMFFSILITNLLFVLIFNTGAFIWLLPLYTLIFVGFISYAIVRHRFLDISLIVARTVSFAVLVGISSLIYVFLSVITSSMLLGVMLETNTIAIFTVLTLLVASSFQPLRRVLEKLTDKIFYKDKYDMNQLLYNSALTMASALRLEDLTHQLLDQILSEMRISKGSFILLDKDGIYGVSHQGYQTNPELEESKLRLLTQQNKMIVLEELPEGELKEAMKAFDFNLVSPLHAEAENIGLFVLGGKLSGDIYSEDDIKVIEILTPEIAVAIQNTKSYEEIRRFNITLQEEVNKATADLQKANERLKELDKLKDDFVSVASHELRTPMAAIRSYTWMAIHKSDIPLSEKLNKYLSRVLISTERLINLVNDMLNISRIESGRIQIDPKVFKVNDLIDEVLSEVEAKAKEKGVSLEVVKEAVPQVFSDPDKIHQVLLNLIGNALKFTPMDGKITISLFSDGHMVEVAVKDSGVGISKEDTSRLFQKFGRLDNSYVAMGTSGGTGLGLFICKSLVELMKGKIWVSSEGLGKGTTFTFSIPVATADVLKDADKYKHTSAGEAKGLEPVAI